MNEITMTPPESDRAAQRRHQVLDAAAICFRNHGFHGASMALISKTAGMSPGHIYHYFDSKEAIIAAIVDRDLEEMMEWTEIFYSSDDILQTMVDGVTCGVDANTNPECAALMLEIMAESARNPQVAATVQKSNQICQQRLTDLLIKEMAQRGAVSSVDVQVKTDLISAMFDGLLMKSIHNPTLDKDALTVLMRKVMLFVLTL
nr:TetR/AcrR family transcriptional regulator [uncultured Tolumonas sp.]